MTIKVFCHAIRFASVVLLMLGATSGYVFSQATSQVEDLWSPTASTQPSADVKGNWSGTLFSKHSSVQPFTVTVVISPDSQGHLVGNSSLNSDCLKGAHLQVTVNGSNVVLAGSSDAGDTITIRGTVDSTGTLLKASYILNGSPSGNCETDDGTGNLTKR